VSLFYFCFAVFVFTFVYCFHQVMQPCIVIHASMYSIIALLSCMSQRLSRFVECSFSSLLQCFTV